MYPIVGFTPETLTFKNETLAVSVSDRVVFEGAMQYIHPAKDFEKLLPESINHLIGCRPWVKRFPEMTKPAYWLSHRTSQQRIWTY